MSYNLRVESYDFWDHRGQSCAKRAKHLGSSEAGVPSSLNLAQQYCVEFIFISIHFQDLDKKIVKATCENESMN